MITLLEAVKALEGREEFAVKRLDGMIIINYLITLHDSFDGIRENFRGIVFNESTGEIVSLPLHKFYNVGQKDHTQINVIGQLEANVFEKFDGTMVHALEVNGEILLSTRMGWDTDHAIAATKLMKKSGLEEKVAKEVRSGYTPIFEYIGPKNQIVIHYPKEELVYLWSRERSSGQYNRNLGVPKHSYKIMTIEEVINELASMDGKEGFVCVTPDLWVKVKSPWYLSRHMALDIMMRPAYRVYEIGLRGELDDLIALSADGHKPKLESIASEVSKDKLRVLSELKSDFEAIDREITGTIIGPEKRKQFALLAKSSDKFSGLMLLYSGKDIDDWVNKYLLDYYKTKYPFCLVGQIAEAE